MVRWNPFPKENEEDEIYERGYNAIRESFISDFLSPARFRPFDPTTPINRDNLYLQTRQEGIFGVTEVVNESGEVVKRFHGGEVNSLQIYDPKTTAFTRNKEALGGYVSNQIARAFIMGGVHPDVKASDTVKSMFFGWARQYYEDDDLPIVMPINMLDRSLDPNFKRRSQNASGTYLPASPRTIFVKNSISGEKFDHIEYAIQQGLGVGWNDLSDDEKQLALWAHEASHQIAYNILQKEYNVPELDDYEQYNNEQKELIAYIQSKAEADANAGMIQAIQQAWGQTNLPITGKHITPTWKRPVNRFGDFNPMIDKANNLQRAFARQDQIDQAKQRYASLRQWAEQRNRTTNQQIDELYNQLQTGVKKGLFGKKAPQFRKSEAVGLLGSGGIEFDLGGRKGSQPRTYRVMLMGNRLVVNTGTGTNRLGGYVLLPDKDRQNMSPAELLAEGINYKGGFGKYLSSQSLSDEEGRARHISFFQNSLGLGRLNSAFSFDKNANRQNIVKQYRAYVQAKGRTGYNIDQFGSLLDFGMDNQSLMKSLNMKPTIANATGYADVKSKRFSNVGRLDSAVVIRNGQALPFYNDPFGGDPFQVSMQARYLMGAQFGEGETEKHAGIGSLLPEQYELDTSAIEGLSIGQYYGSTKGLGIDGDISGTIKDLAKMGFNVSDSPQLYQVLDIIHNAQSGKSNVVLGRMNESTVEKVFAKPGHKAVDSDLMAFIDEDSPFAGIGNNGRVDFQTRHNSDLLFQARQSAKGAFAVLGQDAYVRALKQFITQNKDSLQGKSIADAFAVHYYTQGVDIDGIRVGGFKWTQVKARLSDSRLAQFVSDSLPKDGDWEYDKDTNKYYRTITYDGITRRVVGNINKTDELGHEVTLNDLVHISPVATELKESFGRGIARIRPDSFIARQTTDPSFGENLRALDEAGIGRTSAYYHVLADTASRQIGVDGKEYLRKLGHNVINANDINFKAIEDQVQGLTGMERAEAILRTLNTMYKDSFIEIEAGESKAYFAPANQMLKMLTEGNNDEVIYNLAGRMVATIESANAKKLNFEGADADFAMSVGSLVQAQQEYVKNANLQTKAAELHLPAVTGHAQVARGLQGNQVVMWMDEIMRKTGMTEDEIRDGILNKKLSAMVTRYPETDQRNAVIGAEILIADDFTDEFRKGLGITNNKNQAVIAGDMWEAMVGDFDADQLQLTFSQYKKDGKIAGGGIKIHSPEEIRAIRDSRFGNEYANTNRKLDARGNVQDYFQREADKALKRVGADDYLGRVSSTVKAKGLIGKMYNLGVRGIFPSARNQFDPNDAVGKTYLDAAGLVSQGLYQPALDGILMDGAEAVADLMYGYVNVDNQQIGLRLDGESKHTKFSPRDANRMVMGMFSKLIRGYEGKEQDLMATNVAKLFMSPNRTRQLMESGDYDNTIKSIADAFIAMGGEAPEKETLKELSEMMLGKEDKVRLPLFSYDAQDPGDTSFLGSVISGMVAKRTRENAQEIGTFNAENMTPFMRQQGDFMAGVLEQVKSIIPHKSFRGEKGGSILSALGQKLGQFSDMLRNRFGDVGKMMSMSSLPAELAKMTGATVPHPNANLMYMGDKTVNLSFGQNPTRVLDDDTRMMTQNYISGSALNKEFRESDEQWRKRIAAMGVIPKEWLGGLHSDEMKNMGRDDRDLIQNLVNFTRQNLGLQPRNLTDSKESLAGAAIHSDVQRYLLGDVADIKHVNYEDMGNGRFRAVFDPRARAEVRVVDDEAGISGTLDAIYKGMVLDFKTKKNLNTDVSGYLNQLSAYHMMTVENGGEVNGEKVRRSGIVLLSQEEGLSAQDRLADSALLVKNLIAQMRKAKSLREKRDILHGVYGKDFGRGANLDFEALTDYIERVNNELNDNGDWKIGVIPVLGQEAVDENILDVNLAGRRFDEIKSLTANRQIWNASDAKRNLIAAAQTLLGRAKDTYKSFLRGFKPEDPESFVLPRFMSGKKFMSWDEESDESEEWGEKPSPIFESKEIGVFETDTEGKITADSIKFASSDPKDKAKIEYALTLTQPKYFPMKRGQVEQFYKSVDYLFGTDLFQRGGQIGDSDAFQTPQVGVEQLRQMGFDDDAINKYASKSPFDLIRNDVLLNRVQQGGLTQPQLANIQRFAQSTMDVIELGRQSTARFNQSGGTDPYANAIRNVIEQFRAFDDSEVADEISSPGYNSPYGRRGNRTLRSATYLAHLLGGEGDAKSESAASALQKFINTTGELTPQFKDAIESMTKGFQDGGEAFENATQKFEAWNNVMGQFQKAIMPALEEQLTSGSISKAQYEGLKDAQGVGGSLVRVGKSGQYELDTDVYNATISNIQSQMKKAMGIAKESTERRSQKSWQEMVGLSHEGASTTRKLSKAWGDVKFGEKFADGTFGGETKGLGLGLRVSGTSILSAALNPYNMFAAQRVWGIAGRPAMTAMNDYQANRMNQEFMAFQGGFASGDELTSGMFGLMQQRSALHQRRHLAMGRGANYAYGGLADIATGGTIEGLSSIGGVVMPAIGAGMGVAAALKGASVLNILSGGAGFAGLANPLGLAVGGTILTVGGISALSSAGHDYDAFARKDPWAVIGARLGAITNVGEYQRKERYSQSVQRYSQMLLSGGADIDLSGFSETERTGIRYLGFENAYGEKGQKLFGEKYNEGMQGTYRIAQTIDPAFSMLANNEMTNNIMEMQRRYGTEPSEAILMAASKASGYDRPMISISDLLSNYMANTQDSAAVITERVQSSINAAATANQYRVLMGQPALTYENFMGYRNDQERGAAGSLYNQLSQTQYGTTASSTDYLANRATQFIQSGNFEMAQRYANAYEMSAPMVGSGRQIMELLGATPLSQTVYGHASAFATERYMENPAIAQSIDQMLQHAIRSTRGGELLSYYSANINSNGEITFLPPPERIQNLIGSARYPEEINVSRVGEGATLVMGRWGDEWRPYSPHQSSSLNILLENIYDNLPNIGDSHSIPREHLQGVIAADLELTNRRGYENYMAEFANKSGQFIAMGGNPQALINRAIRQRGIRMSDYQGIADVNFDIMNEIAYATPEQLARMVGASMSEAPLSAIDSFNAKWGTGMFSGQTDFTEPYAAENAISAVSALDSVMMSLPRYIGVFDRSFVQSRLQAAGLGSAYSFANREGLIAAQYTSRYAQMLQNQGFLYEPERLAEISAIYGTTIPGGLPREMIMRKSGEALNAAMYRVDQSDQIAVGRVEAGIFDQMSDAAKNYGLSAPSVLADFGTAQFRLQAGIMGRTTGMGETAFLDASSLTNNDLMTQSIQTNAARLFEAFSKVLIENASLSRESQQAIADMTLGGLDYNDEYAVQGRLRGLGRYSSAMNMLGRYMATGTSADQISQMAMQTFGMSSEQFAQWQAMENQNPYVMSQNLAGAQARWGSGAVPIAPINLQTGQATTLTQLAPGGNMGFINALRGQNNLFKGAFLAPYMTDDWLANIGGTAGIQGEIMNLQMSTQGASAAHGRRMLNLRNAMNLGGGTLDSQGYVVGGSLQLLQQMLTSAGYNFNVGNNMTAWQIQDRRDQMSREMTLWDLNRQGRDKELQKRQFYEKWDFGYRRWDYNTNFQREEMQIGRQQQLQQRAWTQQDMAFSRNQQVTQFVWQREDMAFGRARNALEFGWQTEDFERNKRYARGRERINLLREQERANIRYNMDVGQADKQEDRQRQQEQWAQEQFDKQMERFNVQVQWEDQRFERQIEHFNIINAFELEQMLMEKRHFEERMALADEDFEKKKAHTLELMKLEDQERLLSRQTSLAFADIDQKFSEAMAGVQKKITELSNLLTGIGQTDNSLGALLKLEEIIGAPVPAWMDSLWTNVLDERGMSSSISTTKDKKIETTDGGFIGDLEGVRAGFENLRGSIDPLSKGISTLGNHSIKTMNQLEELIKRVESVSVSSQKYAQSLSIVNAQMSHASASFDSLVNSLSRMAGVGGADNIDMLRNALERLAGATPTVNSAIMSTYDVLGTFGGRIKQLANAVSESIAQLNHAINNVPKGTKGYAEGGYTGDGEKYAIAGVVHKGEYVVPQEGVPVLRESGVSTTALLDELRAIRRELEKIYGLGPGRININATTNNLGALTQGLISDANRVKALR